MVPDLVYKFQLIGTRRIEALEGKTKTERMGRNGYYLMAPITSSKDIKT